MLLLFDIENMKIEEKRTNLRKEFGIHKNEIKITITKIDLSVFCSKKKKKKKQRVSDENSAFLHLLGRNRCRN